VWASVEIKQPITTKNKQENRGEMACYMFSLSWHAIECWTKKHMHNILLPEDFTVQKATFWFPFFKRNLFILNLCFHNLLPSICLLTLHLMKRTVWHLFSCLKCHVLLKCRSFLDHNYTIGQNLSFHTFMLQGAHIIVCVCVSRL